MPARTAVPRPSLPGRCSGRTRGAAAASASAACPVPSGELSSMTSTSGAGTRAAPARSTAKAPPPRPKSGDEEDDPNPYDVTDLDLTPRCPHCAGEMESRDAVVCLHCGYNVQTREKAQTVKTIKNTFAEWVVW